MTCSYFVELTNLLPTEPWCKGKMFLSEIVFSSPQKEIYGWSYISGRASVKWEHIVTIFTIYWDYIYPLPLLVWVRRRKKTLLLRNSVWSSVAQFLCLNKQCGYTPEQPQEPGGSGLNWKCCGTVMKNNVLDKRGLQYTLCSPVMKEKYSWYDQFTWAFLSGGG